MDAIIYTSNTGTTAEYAHLLGTKTGLPVYEMNQAKAVRSGAEIIYLGWVMASEIKGYKQAAKKWKVAAACGVCMGATGSQLKEVREKNKIPEAISVFTLQGGFDIRKLTGVYKMMMNIMVKTAGKGLAQKQDKTPDEEQMLEMMLHGGNYVSEENLSAVYEWMESQK